MYRRGIVKELDAAKHRAKVAFPDKGGVLSPWLDVLVFSTLVDKAVGMPAVEMQVACMLDEKEEAGCIIGALYSEADPPPATSLDKRSITFGDNGLLEYDRAAHVLTVTMPSGGHVVVNVSGAGKVKLAGDADDVALAALVKAEIAAQKGAFDSHTHASGALVAPPGGGPVTGVTGGPLAPAPSVGEVKAANVRSA